jgi:hypothetical protein
LDSSDLADQGLTVVVPLRQEVLDGSLACASCAAPKESLFEAVVDAVMREVHAKLVGEVASLADPMQALERGIRVFLKVCSDPKLQRILLIDAPAVPGWPKWRDRCALRNMSAQAGARRGDESRNVAPPDRRHARPCAAWGPDGSGDGHRPVANCREIAQGG